MRVMPHVLDREHHLAGSDTNRAFDITAAFEDPTIDAVFCSRGGYGCARLLEHLQFDSLAATGKLFAGFSDVTTLHFGLNQSGLATLHSPMPLSFSVRREPWVYESLWEAIEGRVSTTGPAPRGETLRPGVSEGEVTGGCLCLIADSIGTRYAIDARGKVLLIEDVDEPPHRIDAMLTHLLNVGVLQDAAGIVVGEMTRTDERIDEGIGGPPWREIVHERLSRLEIPIVVGYPFGHCQAMLSLPLGIRARLDANAGTLDYVEPLCCV